MKTSVYLFLSVLLWVAGCSKSPRDKWAAPESSDKSPPTFSSLDKPSAANQRMLPSGTLKLTNVDSEEVLKLYQNISGRTVIRSGTLPSSKITLETAQPVTVIKALQFLDTALAQNGIVMIPQGTDVVKAVPRSHASTEAVPVCQLKPEELPESDSYTHYVVHVKNHRPRDVAQMLQPFAKMPNSILGIDAEQVLVLRDYAVNIRRMMQVLEELERDKPGSFFSQLFKTNAPPAGTNTPFRNRK